MHKRLTIVVLAGLVALSLGTAKAAPVPGSPLVGTFCSSGGVINGTGSTFAVNAYADFKAAYTAACNKGTVNYTGTGSGAGKASFTARTVAWGGTDEAFGLDELALATTGGVTNASPVHTIPVAVGAVTVSYNTGCTTPTLNFRSQVLSAIFTGLVTRWDDTLLTVDNAALANCHKAIKLVVRSDGSGTTFAFKDYLSKRNPVPWMAYKQPALNTAWPAEDLGLNFPARASGNGGLASTILATAGSIGYVELSTAIAKGTKWGAVDGPHGLFLTPEGAGCDLAAIGAATPPSTLLPGWDQVSITDTPNPLAYPVCSLTYALVFNNLHAAYPAMTQGQAQTLVDFLGVAVDDAGQAGLPAHHYWKLPPTIQTIAKLGLATIAYV